MADAVISVLLDQLAKIARERVEDKGRLVMGVGKEVENLRSNLVAIKAVLTDAERKQLRDDGVKLWLDELKDVSYDADSVLDEWITAIDKSKTETEENGAEISADQITEKKVCFSVLFSCFLCGKQAHQIISRLEIAQKIQSLTEKIDKITIRKDAYNFRITSTTNNFDNEPVRPSSNSILDVPMVYGQDSQKKILIDLLIASESNQVEGNKELQAIQFIPIVGMGGIGKTTSAKNVYNDAEVKAHFGDNRAWVCVSEPFNLVQIAKEIAKQLPAIVGSGELMQRFHDSVKDKKFLLVLDDVWISNYQEWQPLEQVLRSGAAGSRIVVTTRKEEVVRMVGDAHMIRMNKLSEENCWSLLSKIAFFGKTEEEREDFKDISWKIAKKCDGLPLAAKTLGSLLRVKKTEEWLHVLENDMWRLDNVKENLFYPLLLSYYDLPHVERRCFSYCAIFPKDYKIDREDLIQQWMAQGYFKLSENEAEATGEKCFNNLAMRSFFQDFEYDDFSDKSIKSCKMHDIVHDFAQFLKLKEYSTVSVTEARESLKNNGRHLNVMIQSKEPISFPISVSSGEKLHTLVVSSLTACSFPNGLSDFKCLRSLSLTLGGEFQLPSDIGDLIHLRYLRLFANYPVNLPATIGDLFNLQTLKLCCESNLSEEVGKLINLRHLYARRVICPQAIGRLKHLQTAKEILCGHAAFKLQGFMNLNNLHHIHIKHLSVSQEQLEGAEQVEGARQAQLYNKTKLVNLVLNFWGIGQHEETDTNVLEALQPHQNLRYLNVSGYSGLFISPSWMISLINLEKLVFRGCYNCERLPPLGKLPSLQSLTVYRFRSLKDLGSEFLGIENGSRDDNASITLFPKLKELKIERVNSSEWIGIAGCRPNGSLKIMPRLENLILRDCWYLGSLPDFLETTPLKKLVIEGCPELETSCKEEMGKDWPKIRHVTDIQIR